MKEGESEVSVAPCSLAVVKIMYIMENLSCMNIFAFFSPLVDMVFEKFT